MAAQHPKLSALQEEKKTEKEGTIAGGIKPAEAVATAGGSGGSGDAVDEAEGSLGVFSTCGTTSLIVVVTDLHVICCNTGDSR